ncbi:MAG TPA: M13 family metallopeptidase N-terminal domain-containing protein, partial [Polyangiaceae bacterium]|nr:M13 family metallopeptidase N-terminal domain-containing protein [Polyangiaceae bacterium]
MRHLRRADHPPPRAHAHAHAPAALSRRGPGRLLLALGLAAGCASAPAPSPDAAPRPAAAAVRRATLAEVGLDATALDRSADPCRDFYQFACGGWLARAALPDDKPYVERGFDAISDRNEARLRALAEGAAASADPAVKRVGDYYAACVDEAAVERAGLSGVEPLLRRARGVRDPASLVAAIAELHRHGAWAPFEARDEQDFRNATRVIVTLDQGGLGLPDRDYYVNDDASAKELRAKYLAHVERTFGLAGRKAPEAKRAAADVLALETELAKASKTPLERRDPGGMYNKVDRAGLAALAPHVDWDAYFRGLGFPDAREVNVTAKAFFAALDRAVVTFGPAAWSSYLEWHALRRSAAALPKAFVDEAFALEQALTGQKRQRERWKRC